jgi:two-component system, NarL family, nitrate/nitrite response regulator NarL
VLLADDHPVYLDGLVAAIDGSPGLELVGTCDDGHGALEQIRAHKPDVAALDLLLPGLTATAILNALDADDSATRVLVLSAYTDSQAVFDAIQAGARGYIPKSWPRTRICDAIGEVARGRTVLADEVQDGIGEEIRRRGSAAQERLTDREREILLLLAEGMSAPDIGQQLHLSVSTVKSHQHGLYEKLGVADRAAAVAAALRRGLIR